MFHSKIGLKNTNISYILTKCGGQHDSEIQNTRRRRRACAVYGAGAFLFCGRTHFVLRRSARGRRHRPLARRNRIIICNGRQHGVQCERHTLHGARGRGDFYQHAAAAFF